MQELKGYRLTTCGDRYDLTLTTCDNIDEDTQMRYTAIGFRVENEAGETVLEFSDISTNRNFVETFIRTCIDHEVALVHIADLLEDCLD